MLDDYLRGDITYESFKDKTTALLHDVPDKGKDTFTQLVNGLTNAAEGISYGASNGTAAFVQGFRDFADGMADFYDEFYDGVIDPISNIFDSLWDKFCNDNGYVTSDVDMHGYGAYASLTSNGEIYHAYYGAYGIINDTGNAYIFPGEGQVYYSEGKGPYQYSSSSKIVTAFIDSRWSFIGDWRLEDGSPADDLTTPVTNTPVSPGDIDPNTDLTDFLQELLDKLKNMFPDLSTIEGLLRAILAQCVSINGKLDDGSGNIDYSELSQLLDSSILSLISNNNQNNQALLDELINLRKSVDDIEINGEEPDEGFFDEVTDTLDDILPDLSIDIGSVSDIVDICKDAGTLGVKFLKTLVDLIILLNDALPLVAVQAIMMDIENFISVSSDPKDFTFTVFNTEVTLLSASFFTSESVSNVLQLIRAFISIIIIYGWLKWFRRFMFSHI